MLKNDSTTHNVILTCSCGATQSGGTEDHNFGTPTDNKDGTQHSQTCPDCGYVKTEAHTEVTDPEEPATCTTAGKTEGKHCSVCGTTIVKQEEIPAKGHNYVDVESTTRSNNK